MPFEKPREAVKRAGTVAIVGRPNVGKSTLLNGAVGQTLAIVSKVPQTTRDRILGVVRHGEAQIALLDTPGLHKPHSRLGRAMNVTARDAAREADLVVYVTDIPPAPRPPLRPHPGDKTLLTDIGKDVPTILVVNKIDRARDKSVLLPLLESLSKLRDFAAIIPISALSTDGLDRILDEIAKNLPERGPLFDDDMLTDRPMRFFAAEFVREQIFLATREEVPHAVAVQIERYEEGGKVVQIEATILVEREGQKGILVGEKGERLKGIGVAARMKIQEMIGHKVNLKLWVKVAPGWTESQAALEDLGYGASK